MPKIGGRKILSGEPRRIFPFAVEVKVKASRGGLYHPSVSWRKPALVDGLLALTSSENVRYTEIDSIG